MDQENTLSPYPIGEAPPPPYSLCPGESVAGSIATASVRKTPVVARPRPREAAPPVGPLPPSWNLYHTLSVGRVLMLGPHEHEPLLAVSRHMGWWTGQPDIVLHRGPSDTLPPLAAGMGGVRGARHSIIVLPPMPGSMLDSSQELLLRVEEKADWPPQVRFRFVIEVGFDPNQWRREAFEWRHSHESSQLEAPRSSDGCEIVAVWAYARLSMTKVLRFRFIGNGAAGVFGERWALMAAMTALRMYQRQQRSRDGDW
ncbi:hypothetical protein GGR54DRAFT_644324 [Hypoxylon sp. NC1633]|nr:hypothetical protein GGR54DRAFT_644324 [Hypoxylon sp. NC1633]